MAIENQTVKVFVSSTWEDLQGERALVLEGIRHLQFEHVAMEYFGADPRQPIKVCLEKVRESNVYVGIVGHRYGKIVEETGKSYTQMEYEEAKKRNMPCLIFIRSDEFPIPAKFMEKKSSSLKKLERFKSILKEQQTPTYFNDGNDLTIRVIVALSKNVKELDYGVLNKILEYVNTRLYRIQRDDDLKFHYLQHRLEGLGLIKTIGAVCPVCGRLLEADEPTIGYKHPVCADCIVYRTDDLIEQLQRDHPDLLDWVEPLKIQAEKYLKERSKPKK